MTDTPRISVVMPVYNAQRFVSQAVQSILGQTLGDFEFIILDDASTDGSAQVLRELARRDERIKLHECEHAGCTALLNQGIALAKAPLIARMDADDVSLPQRLERQAAFLHDHPDISGVGAAVQRIDETGRLIRVAGPSRSHGPVFWRWRLHFGHVFYHPTMMLRKTLFAQVGGYRQDILHGQDYEMWLRATRTHRLDMLPEILLQLRSHERNVTASFRDSQRHSARRALAEALTDMLGTAVTEEEADRFGAPRLNRTREQVVRSFELIELLHRAFVAGVAMTEPERRLIDGDAAERLAKLARRLWLRSPVTAWRLLGRARALGRG